MQDSTQRSDDHTHDDVNRAAKTDLTETSYQAGKSAAANRWLLIIIGVVTIIAGFVALAMPFLASLTVAIIVGWVLIISGAVGLFTAFRRHEGWHIAAAFALSVVSIIGGALMLVMPIAGIFALSTVLIAYFGASGVMRLWYGARAMGDGGGVMVAAGLLSVALALLLWFGLPFSATWLPGVLLGIDLVMWGALQVAFAARAGGGSGGTTAA